MNGTSRKKNSPTKNAKKPALRIPDEIRKSIIWHVIEKGLGYAPSVDGDPDEWLSLRAIGFVIDRDKKTLQNRLSVLNKEGKPLPREHPFMDGYYQLTDFVERVYG